MLNVHWRKVVSALGLSIIMLAVAACGGEGQIADTPTPEAKVVAKVEVEPSPTNEPTKPEPTNPPTSTPTTASPPPTATSIPPTVTQQYGNSVLTLKISEIAAGIPDYDRDDWKHWTDEDGDCQNIRHEVLIEESLKDVSFKSDRQCQVATGEWLVPYTGVMVTDATTLDVDHMVPLKNAHNSGGWAWDKDKKASYANEMGYADHLIAVTASANRQKGARGPDEWKPSNEQYMCDYAVNWIQIKNRWELTATKSEGAALQEMIKTCSNPPSLELQYLEVKSPQQMDTISETAKVSDSPEIQITSMDCNGKPEVITIENMSDSAKNLTGWKIEDDGPKHTYTFEHDFTLEPKSTVQLISAGTGEDSSTVIYWYATSKNVWNNDGDIAHLYDSSGELVHKMECP